MRGREVAFPALRRRQPAEAAHRQRARPQALRGERIEHRIQPDAVAADDDEVRRSRRAADQPHADRRAGLRPRIQRRDGEEPIRLGEGGHAARALAEREGAQPALRRLRQRDHDVFGAAQFAGRAHGQRRGHLRLLPRRQAGQRADHRHHEFVEGEDSAGREARQHHQRHPPHGREAQRLARLERHAVHDHARRAQTREDAVRHIPRALAGAARHHDQVGALQRIAHRRFERRFLVAEDAHRHRHTAVLGHGGAEDRGVAVGDAARRQRRAGRDQLVAGRDHRHARSAHHWYVREAGGGEHADLAARDHRAGAQQRLPARDVAAGEADELAGRHGALQQHGRAVRRVVELRPLDHRHRIGAARDHAAGGDGGGGAGGDLDPLRDAAGEQFRIQPQPHRRALRRRGGIRRAQRETIHRGPVEGRRIRRRDDGFRDHAAEAGRKRHPHGGKRVQVQGGAEAARRFLGGDDLEELFLPRGAAHAVQQVGGGVGHRTGHSGRIGISVSAS